MQDLHVILMYRKADFSSCEGEFGRQEQPRACARSTCDSTIAGSGVGVGQESKSPGRCLWWRFGVQNLDAKGDAPHSPTPLRLAMEAITSVFSILLPAKKTTSFSLYMHFMAAMASWCDPAGARCCRWGGVAGPLTGSWRLRPETLGRPARRPLAVLAEVGPWLPRGPCELLLDSPRQLVLPLRRDERVLTRHLEAAVAGDFGGFDGAAADLLPPGDVGAAEGCGPSPGKSQPSACAVCWSASRTPESQSGFDGSRF